MQSSTSSVWYPGFPRNVARVAGHRQPPRARSCSRAPDATFLAGRPRHAASTGAEVARTAPSPVLSLAAPDEHRVTRAGGSMGNNTRQASRAAAAAPPGAPLSAQPRLNQRGRILQPFGTLVDYQLGLD